MVILFPPNKSTLLMVIQINNFKKIIDHLNEKVCKLSDAVSEMSSTARTTSVIQSDNFSAAEEYETDPIALFREVLLFFLSCQLHDRFSVHLFMLNYYIAIIF